MITSIIISIFALLKYEFRLIVLCSAQLNPADCMTADAEEEEKKNEHKSESNQKYNELNIEHLSRQCVCHHRKY